MASYIPSICSTTDQNIALPRQISQEFKSFYEKLYNLTKTPPTPDSITDYITSSRMPILPNETRELLEDPITLSELQLAIKNTKLGKAPGPD